MKQCFYFAFFGQLLESTLLSPAQTSSPSSDSFLPYSLLFIPDNRVPTPGSSVVSATQRRREGLIDSQSYHKAAQQDWRQQKQQAKEHRQQERRRQRELRRSRPPYNHSPTIQDINDYDMEGTPAGPPIVHPEKPEGMEGERTNIEVDSPVIPSNDDLNNHKEMEESNSFNSNSERASTATHVQFSKESEVAPDRADRALTSIFKRTSTKEALAQPAANALGDLEIELQRELDCLQQDTEERAKDTREGNAGAESPATKHAIMVRQSMMDGEDILEEGTIHSATAHSTDQAEAHQELLDDTLVYGPKR
jgi:hypothetical protein